MDARIEWFMLPYGLPIPFIIEGGRGEGVPACDGGEDGRKFQGDCAPGGGGAKYPPPLCWGPRCAGGGVAKLNGFGDRSISGVGVGWVVTYPVLLTCETRFCASTGAFVFDSPQQLMVVGQASKTSV